MKSTGIVRKVDDLGRVVLPKELRNVLQIDSKTALEIYVEEDKIILRKFEASLDREEKFTVLVNLQNLAQIESDPNVKDTIVRAIALIQ